MVIAIAGDRSRLKHAKLLRVRLQPMDDAVLRSPAARALNRSEESTRLGMDTEVSEVERESAHNNRDSARSAVRVPFRLGEDRIRSGGWLLDRGGVGCHSSGKAIFSRNFFG